MSERDDRGLRRGIGAKIRELRIEKELSLRTLAGRTGFSPSFISQIEAEAVSPSIASLAKVAEELGVTLGQFFSSIEALPREVVRREERLEYKSRWSKSTVSLISDSSVGRRVSLLEVRVGVGGESGEGVFGVQETVLLLLSGRLRVELAGEEAKEIGLDRGDSVYIREGTTFRWKNIADEEATLLVCAAPGRADLLSIFAEHPLEENANK